MRKLLSALTFLIFLPCYLFAQSFPQLAADINPGVDNSYVTCITRCNNKLYFCAKTTPTGNELWSYDASGSISLVDVNTGALDGVAPNMLQPFPVIGNTLYFVGNTASASGVMMSYDGTNLHEIIDPSTGTHADFPVLQSVAYNGKLYGGSFTDFRIFDSATNTVEIVGDSVFACTMPAELNGKIYFGAGANTSLHVYDPATNHISDVQPSILSGVGYLIHIGNKLYFFASTPGAGRELCSYDGNGAPQVLTNLQPISPVLGGAWHEIAQYGGYIYFGGDDGVHGMELLKLDTLTQQVSLVADIYTTGLSNSAPMWLTFFNDKLYFTAKSPAGGRELFVTDGSTTSMITQGIPGSFATSPEELTIFNNELYFSASSMTYGLELFKLKGVTGVSYLNPFVEASIYPNPAKEKLNFDFNIRQAESIGVSITDATGKLIRQTACQHYATGKNSLTVSLSGLISGTYQYRLRNQEGKLLKSGSFTVMQ
jgi:ELWxxDGT repeat protein